MNVYLIFSFIISLICSYISLPMIIKMLGDAKVVSENYKSNTIPTSMGIEFIFVQVITLGILEIFLSFNSDFNIIYLLGFVFIGFLGLLDDLIGEKKTKGLRGHMKAFSNGVLTTGGIKALLGFFISLVVSSYLSNSIGDLIVNSLIVGLFTNFINIFDLRPGRAIKVFMFISLIYIITGISKTNNYILFSFFGILIPYITIEFKAKAMIGDVGSNILGFSLGIYTATSFNFPIRVIILALLIITHLLAEKVSFSKLIDHNKFLRYLDNLGR